jgi:hypothetical protein
MYGHGKNKKMKKIKDENGMMEGQSCEGNIVWDGLTVIDECGLA